jgi:acetyl esterase/lipase
MSRLKIILIICLTHFIVKNLPAQKEVYWNEIDDNAFKIDSISYINSGNKNHLLYYRIPENTKRYQKNPCIIFIHGGAWTGGDAATFFSYAAYFAQRNITSISINYSLIKNKEDDIINCIKDCKSAIRYIKKYAHFFKIDTNKMVVCGESAGGHLAAGLSLFDTLNHPFDNITISTHPAALILLNPVLNLTTNTFIKYVNTFDLLNTTKKLDSGYLKSKNYLKSYNLSPLYQLKNNFPPTLLINGEEDKITPAVFAKDFSDSLIARNIYCKLILLPNTGHAFAVPHYKSSDIVIVNTINEIDTFLKTLKISQGELKINVKYKFEVH